MKFVRPTYNAKEKVYLSDIQDGFRFSAECEAAVFTPTIENIKTQLTQLVPTIITLTQGWFSKPLTQEWLSPRLTYSIEDVPTDFEGSVIWEAKRLTISKDLFTVHFIVFEMKKAERVIIDFQEEAPSDREALECQGDDIPISDKEVIGIGPTRQMIHKKSVTAARSRAARALFKAESMMQEYSKLYGETDWETDSDSESD